jgi:hypothetical protein
MGYEGLYEISDTGKVYSLLFTNGQVKNKKRVPPLLLKAHKTFCNYYIVGLSKNGRAKSRTVHSLVLETFVGPRPKGHAGAHVDGNKENNHLSNLKWVSYKENEGHKKAHGTYLYGVKHHGAKLNDEKVRYILDNKNIDRKILSKKYGVDKTLITRIRKGLAWKHLSSRQDESGE